MLVSTCKILILYVLKLYIPVVYFVNLTAFYLYTYHNECLISILTTIFSHTCILGQSYNANEIINADIGNTFHPKISEFRMRVKQHFSCIITNETIQNMHRIENTRLTSSSGRNSNFTDIAYGCIPC